MDNMENKKHEFKILVIGDAGVGKTAIIQKFVSNFYPEMYKQSIGCDFFSKRLDLPDNSTADLTIWDCSSESLKSKMLQMITYGSDAVFFVYDITNKSSFEAIPNIINTVKYILTDSPKKVEYVVIGNKNDLFNQIAVEDNQAQHLCKTLEMKFYSVSAKNGTNLTETFHQTACKLCGIPVEEKTKEKLQQDSSLPDLRDQVKSTQKQSNSSSSCIIF